MLSFEPGLGLETFRDQIFMVSVSVSWVEVSLTSLLITAITFQASAITNNNINNRKMKINKKFYQVIYAIIRASKLIFKMTIKTNFIINTNLH